MATSNYGGKQPNNTSYIKNFIYGAPPNLWKTMAYQKTPNAFVSVITTASNNFESLYIKGDLFIDGNIISPSDINIKTNVSPINTDISDKIMNLKPVEFVFTDDLTNHKHYGFIAQELEIEFPELIQIKPDTKYNKIKAVNYLEIVPLLVNKIQMMQKEIDQLKDKINITI